MHDDYQLQRFLDAQDAVYEDVLAMLREGRMCSPYMDFIYPSLGEPASAGPYAIRSLDEARAYLAFPALGNRYRECVEALSWLWDDAATEVFGAVDARRLQASLTLFAEATNEQLIRSMLAVWYDSRVDEQTMVRLASVP